MGKASSAKKVARAARAGKATKGRERRELGFPLVLAAVILLGTSLVFYARSSRSDAVPPLLNVGPAGSGDYHWHSALGFYRCDAFLSNIERGQEWPDVSGIHTHGDGVIHIHPFSSSATGSRARMKVFFQTMGLKLENDEVELTSGESLKSDQQCDGKPAVLVLARFNANKPEDKPEIIRENFGNVRFLADGEAFTFALVPEDQIENIPLPPTAANLAELGALDSGQAPATSLAPGSTLEPTQASVGAGSAPSTTADPTSTTSAGATSTSSATSR